MKPKHIPDLRPGSTVMLGKDELTQFQSFKGGIREFIQCLWEKERHENAVKDLLDIEDND